MPIRDEIERFRATRAEIERAVLPLAQSLDGSTFAWQSSLDDVPAPVGGYVVLEAADGRRLGQVLDAGLDEAAAAELASAGDGPALRSTVMVRLVRGRGAVLEGPEGSFHDAMVRPATDEDVAAWLQRRSRRGPPLAIGELSPAPGGPATIDARGFGRHTFLCGQSGSGKSHALGVLLEQLLARTTLRIVVLDPNSDYVALDQVRAEVSGEAAARHRQVAPGVVVRSAGGGEERLHVPFVELDGDEQAALLRLDPIADREEYAALLDVLREARPSALEELAELPSDDARRLAQRSGNLGVGALGIWSRGAAGSVLDDLARPDIRCLVVDLGSLPTRTEMTLAAEAVLAALWRRRAARQPTLVVIDEAHNVCPADPADRLSALAAEHVVRIAAEGRKFGLHLLLCTQRPRKIPENALSQCDNLVLMRLNARSDAAFLQEAFSFVPPGLLGLAPAFRLGEALVAGPISPEPTVVRFGARVSREGGAPGV